MTDAATGGTEDADATGATTVLRCGLVLVAGAAGVDLGLALADGVGALTVVEGLILIAVPLLGVARIEAASRLLQPPGRATLAVLLFALVGILDGTFQTHYAQVGSAMIWVAAVVSGPGWIALSVLIAGVGYVAGLAAGGRSVDWMLRGDGRSVIATQEIDLILNGTIGVLAVIVLRRVLTGVPASLEAVRAGGPSLTPQLAAAARGVPMALPRADAAALVAELTPGEAQVLELLAAGRVPKEAARDLDVALPTVRSHIASAKRRTGSRTLGQLVALFAEGRDVR